MSKLFRATYLTLFLFLLSSSVFSQSCAEYMEYVKSKGYGSTYTSYNSEAISKVTFYQFYEDYTTYHFAIVCFKNSSYGCTEYLYQVSSSTKTYYSINYMNSAGEAFWKYIQPHNKNLGCAPEF